VSEVERRDGTVHSDGVERKLTMHLAMKRLTTLEPGSPESNVSKINDRIMYIQKVGHHFRDSLTFSVEKSCYEDGIRMGQGTTKVIFYTQNFLPASNLDNCGSVAIDHAMESLQLEGTVFSVFDSEVSLYYCSRSGQVSLERDQIVIEC